MGTAITAHTLVANLTLTLAVPFFLSSKNKVLDRFLFLQLMSSETGQWSEPGYSGCIFAFFNCFFSFLDTTK